MKDDLLRVLATAREAVVWKLDGLSELDARRPLTPTGTNLLGLVKHLAAVEGGYLGEVFGRPFPEVLPGMEEDDAENDDMFARAEEPREELVARYHRVAEHTAATVAALDLDATGAVPWWPPERRVVTLHRVLLHVIAETHRHAGHADVVRELVDGVAGLRPAVTNLPDGADEAWWAAYRARVQAAAKHAG